MLTDLYNVCIYFRSSIAELDFPADTVWPDFDKIYISFTGKHFLVADWYHWSLNRVVKNLEVPGSITQDLGDVTNGMKGRSSFASSLYRVLCKFQLGKFKFEIDYTKPVMSIMGRKWILIILPLEQAFKSHLNLDGIGLSEGMNLQLRVTTFLQSFIQKLFLNGLYVFQVHKIRQCKSQKRFWLSRNL